MLKSGNNHSALLESFAKIASQPKAEPEINFELLEIAKKQPTLKQILAQFGQATLQNEAPLGEQPLDESSTSVDTMPNAEKDIEGAKSNLVSALVALCGSAEEAKKAIDAHGGLGSEDINSDVPDADVPETDAPPIDTAIDEPSDMPAPMPMM